MVPHNTIYSARECSCLGGTHCKHLRYRGSVSQKVVRQQQLLSHPTNTLAHTLQANFEAGFLDHGQGVYVKILSTYIFQKPPSESCDNLGSEVRPSRGVVVFITRVIWYLITRVIRHLITRRVIRYLITRVI